MRLLTNISEIKDNIFRIYGKMLLEPYSPVLLKEEFL